MISQSPQMAERQPKTGSNADNFYLVAAERVNKLLLMSKSSTAFVLHKEDGDLVIVYERHDTMKAVKHSEWIGKTFGSKVLSNKGAFVYLLGPTPEVWTLVPSYRTQILYIADISFVVMYLEIVPGCVVLESGTGSGSLTSSLARAVSPIGHVYTFDFHEQIAGSARTHLLAQLHMTSKRYTNRLSILHIEALQYAFN
uniref:tRNA (adenine(58)-N(1))-methyltransferase n=1 Tax=Solanum lycopersicum TaxID=4081 RepID=A0A3Q7GSQ9_SOLLC